MKIKSITLSITELNNLLSIDDADVRRQALEALNEAVAEPENIAAGQYADAHPTVQALVERVGRKVEQSRRRAEARAARKQAKEQSAQAKGATQVITAAEAKAATLTVHVQMTDCVVKRLLWLRQHLYKTLDRLEDALTAQPGDRIGPEIAKIMSAMMDSVAGYIDPMMEAAAAYMRTPRRLRPETADVAVTL